MKHLKLLLVVLFLLLKLMIAGYVITQPELVQRGIKQIYVMGDIHGSLDSLLNAGIAAGICNTNSQWIKRNIILLQVGDLIHKGTDSMGVVRTIKQWQQDAIGSVADTSSAKIAP